MQAFEESATGAETTVIKVWMLSQVRALGKVAQWSVRDGRTKVMAGGGVECVLAKRGGEESEHTQRRVAASQWQSPMSSQVRVLSTCLHNWR
jgi:hypothetical protein